RRRDARGDGARAARAPARGRGGEAVSGPSDILVFSERPDVLAELLTPARRLADATGGRVLALVAGDDGGDGRAADVLARGADEVLLAPAARSHDAGVLGAV